MESFTCPNKTGVCCRLNLLVITPGHNSLHHSCKMKIIFIFFIAFGIQISVAKNKDQRGGLYRSSEGIMNVLYIFAQFPDDNFEPAYPDWPKDHQPAYMDNILDTSWTGTPTPGSITDYFAQMSLNKFKYIGKTIFVIAPHSRTWYLKNKKRRFAIHKEILDSLDQKMDFSPFDKWEYVSNYKHRNKPDGILDMIIFVWRNIAQDLPGKDTVKTKLDFNQSQADLGQSGTIYVDNKQRKIETGYGGDYGSGVTVLDAYSKSTVYYGSIHEFAHYLMGGNTQHSGFAFWGMVNRWGVRCQVANTFERNRLKWINVRVIPHIKQTITGISLADFVTTGDAIKLDIDSTKGECFYLENHQALSSWDTPDRDGAKGLYVIHKYGRNAWDMELLPADGRFQWSIAEFKKNRWGQKPTPELPVWQRGPADPVNGHCDTERMPYNYQGKNYTVQINFYKDDSGNVIEKPLYLGDGSDQFDLYHNIFSPWSNINSQDINKVPTGIGFEVMNIVNGKYFLNIYIETAVDAAPSIPQNFKGFLENEHPKISWDAGREPDIQEYEIWKKENNGWNLLTTTTSTSWTDYNTNNNSGTSGHTGNIEYKIRVKDKQGKTSSYTPSLKFRFK